MVVQLDKIKLLLNKKPVPPSKRTVAEALDEKTVAAGRDVEIGVMVMGGAPDPPPQQQHIPVEAEMAAAPGSEKAALEAENKKIEESPSSAMEGVESTEHPQQPADIKGPAVLETAGFWDDLQGFLEQRIRDEGEAVRLRGAFERAWRSSGSNP
jgi:hypothetical protein